MQMGKKEEMDDDSREREVLEAGRKETGRELGRGAREKREIRETLRNMEGRERIGSIIHSLPPPSPPTVLSPFFPRPLPHN